MAKLSHDDGMVDARIVYWGVAGAGKTANLVAVHNKLRSDLRGEIERIPTRIDPSAEYEVLPIELGEIAGLRTRIQMVAVPGGPVHAPTRKQLLDQVDGVVFVVDSQSERIEENAASLAELRDVLTEYGRELSEVPLVVQYNKTDLTDPFALETLYRRLEVPGAAAFEAVASETTGVLQTLSTLSKRVIRTLRDQQFEVTAAPAETTSIDDEPAEVGVVDEDTFEGPVPAGIAVEAEVAAVPGERASETAMERMEEAIAGEADHPEYEVIDDLAGEAQTVLDSPWEEVSEAYAEAGDGVHIGPELTIASVGEATKSGERGVRVPVVLSDKDGRTATLMLSIQLDPVDNGDGG